MSLECGVCERDLRGEHSPDCIFFLGEIVSNGAPDRTKMTWRCDKCGAEWDHLTYGGPCPGRDLQGCHGELRRRKVQLSAID